MDSYYTEVVLQHEQAHYFLPSKLINIIFLPSALAMHRHIAIFAHFFEIHFVLRLLLVYHIPGDSVNGYFKGKRNKSFLKPCGGQNQESTAYAAIHCRSKSGGVTACASLEYHLEYGKKDYYASLNQ